MRAKAVAAWAWIKSHPAALIAAILAAIAAAVVAIVRKPTSPRVPSAAIAVAAKDQATAEGRAEVHEEAAMQAAHEAEISEQAAAELPHPVPKLEGSADEVARILSSRLRGL